MEKFVGVTTKYQTVFECAGDGIVVLKDYKFVECNKKALEIFGSRLGDILGAYPYDLSPENQPDGRNSKEKAIEIMNDALSGKPVFFEWQYKRPDGSLFDAEVTLRRFELPDGVYLLALIRDITERKRIQDKLKMSEELFRAVVESARDCIFIKDSLLKYVMVNKCTAELFGVEREEIIGKSDTDFLLLK